MSVVCLAFLAFTGAAQTGYQYYLTGNAVDVQTETSAGLVLMGGGGDVDEAFRWMIAKSGGGDFVVIRASGADGYNGYIPKLGKVDSVESLVFTDAKQSTDPSAIEKIRNAEALFIAGGDQWNYVSRWRGRPVAEAIQYLVSKHVPIGGTSAGLAILGEYYFGAQYGTVTSEQALADPYDRKVAIGRDFLKLPNMNGIITDSHFARRDRMGRLVTFLSRVVQDGWAPEVRGIGVDEATAVLVEADGSATVIGKNAAYFFRLSSKAETCKPGVALLLRDLGVYRVPNGGKFNLRRWTSEGVESYKVTAEAGKLTTTRPAGLY